MDKVNLWIQLHPFGKVKCFGKIKDGIPTLVQVYHSGIPTLFFERGGLNTPRIPCWPFSNEIISEIESMMLEKIKPKQ